MGGDRQEQGETTHMVVVDESVRELGAYKVVGPDFDGSSGPGTWIADQ